MDINVDMIFKIAAIRDSDRGRSLIRYSSGPGREDQAMMTTLAGIVVVLFIIITMISDFFSTAEDQVLCSDVRTAGERKNRGMPERRTEKIPSSFPCGEDFHENLYFRQEGSLTLCCRSPLWG